MGSSQSHLNIHLLNTIGKYGQKGYHVEPTKTVATECKNFEVVTHKINYNGSNSKNFDIYIYNNKRPYTKDSYIFAYCSPNDKNQVVSAVKVYVSTFSPDEPLVISFLLNSGHTHNCLPSVLKGVGWDYAANITGHSFSGDLTKKLPELYEKVSLNWKIQFLADGDAKTQNFLRYESIDKEDKYKRYIYKPSFNKATMASKDLFSNIKPNTKNRIDSSYLGSVNKQFFDGIVVYANEGIALVLEFLDPCKKIHIQRKDKDATYWAQEELEYTDDASLETKLQELRKSSDEQDIVTYMLDKSDKYNDITVTPDDVKTTSYTKYTHKSTEEGKKPNIVFEGVKVTIGGKPYDTKTKTLEVYFLRVNGSKGEVRDRRPFLIVFDENGEGEKAKKKTYHFNNTEKFDDWIEYDEKKSGDLAKKLEEIGRSGGCSVDIQFLRSLAHQILVAEPAEDTKKEKPPDATRPEIYVPKPETKGPPLEWIITGSVGGVVVVSSSAVGYGVYWYNTTIKLLT
ncbi:hypothetical protein MACJ_000568 [Theileria orientalis]|uniref:Uncharacterized protein n=1 Tax=Theileria orientalis TaxID=68886 RepID=A0A976M492_THEOR|nr:hypothetical protein MACJ_000568 [Theileria orientalis]